MSEFLGGVIFVVILICIIVHFWSVIWPILLGVALFVAAIWAIIAAIAHDKKKREEKEASIRYASQKIREEEQKKAAIVESQKQLLLYLDGCNDFIQKTDAQANMHSEAFERNRHIAESEFEVRAFAPFWDAIENMANNISSLNQSNRLIVKKFSDYLKSLKKLDSHPPFIINVKNSKSYSGSDSAKTSKGQAPVKTYYLYTGEDLASQFSDLVRKAQIDYQFSTIFEQRRTNKILIAGFSNLSEAINGLETALADTGTKISGAMREYEETKKEHDEKQLKMLDNLQRRQSPPAIDLDDPEAYENKPHEVWIDK